MLHNYFLVSENIKHTDFYFWKIIEHFEIILIKLITQFYDRIYILRTISNIFCSYTSIYQNFYEGCKTWIWFKKNCFKNENVLIESQLARLKKFFRENFIQAFFAFFLMKSNFTNFLRNLTQYLCTTFLFQITHPTTQLGALSEREPTC